MKALLARIPRDRSLLLLLAPLLVLVAFLAAGRSEDQYSALPVGATVPTSTTSTTLDPFSAEGAAAAEQAAEVEGTSVSRAGTTSGSGSSSSGSGSSARSGSSSSAGSGGNSAAAQDTTTTSELPEWVNPDGSTTSTTPGTTTTTVPEGEGPDPAVNEVPVAILLPVSAIAVAAIAGFVLARRRRASDHTPSPPTRPTTSA